MRKLILQMQMSLDGYVAAASPALDWQVWNWGEDWNWDDELKRDFNAVFESIDCILLGRKMVEEGYLDHWGRVAQNHPADPHYAFARKIVETNKVVLTSKLKASKWDRTEIVRGSMVDEVNALKRRPGRNIIAFGGVGFASSLVAAGLVDEFQFFVNPTAVGSGRSIFEDAHTEGPQLQLIGSASYDCGIVVNRYAP
ncbi:Dihydrofolate reductase [Variovorax sp. CF079]|uniref:dihydrofolate reductase family protein n=1 Tax=Variovorax sp. CF079 TaxID=1882774 RepID=UPI0008856E2E|nr:dihydrofolate reductase family protein [Variovorax sp. CF079]SDC80712.1 Dihydrofolate reductase [Variovorax sp. CF079]